MEKSDYKDILGEKAEEKSIHSKSVLRKKLMGGGWGGRNEERWQPHNLIIRGGLKYRKKNHRKRRLEECTIKNLHS